MAEKLSKRVENTVWKGDIAPYEQFLLFPVSKGVIVWEWVNHFLNDKFDSLKFKTAADYKSNIGANELKPSDMAENIVGMGENSGYQHFLLFPQCFQNTSVAGL